MGVGIGLVFVLVCVLVVRLMLSEDVDKRKRQIQKVTIVKPPPPPPPPPEVEEPEPEIEEQIEEPEPEPEPEMPDEAEAPQDDQLGLDAEGTAGSDAFGLKAKRGGSPIIGGGGGGSQYLWYTRILVDELQRQVSEVLKKKGGLPKESLQTIVRIYMDDQGGINDFKIVGSSGNPMMDDAVRQVLSTARFRQAPPVGMPKAMQFKIFTQG